MEGVIIFNCGGAFWVAVFLLMNLVIISCSLIESGKVDSCSEVFFFVLKNWMGGWGVMGLRVLRAMIARLRKKMPYGAIG